MRIWTIQTAAAWDYLNEHGRLQATRQHQSGDWPEAYEWMHDQLTERVGAPPHPDAAPLWGWYQWASEAQKRPDLRAVRHYWKPLGQYVLIECELPDAAVMLSDFDAWHIILNNQYVSISDEDEETYLAARRQYDLQPSEGLAEHLRTAFYRSWERIIDMDALAEPDWHAMEKKSIQACFWKLDLDQVKSYRLFTSVDARRPQGSGSALSRSSTMTLGR
jgi:hypothetical protein